MYLTIVRNLKRGIMPAAFNSKISGELRKLAGNMKNIKIRELFASDSNRFSKYSVNFDDLLFDYSKHLINEDIMESLFALADEAGVKEMRNKMFNGEYINHTEKRAVLHTALRNKSGNPVKIDGKDVMDNVNKELRKIKDFSDKFHEGIIKGFTGKSFDTIVNIGIGGSDLGPKMVCEALKPYSKKNLKAYFVSNVDGTDITETLRKTDPETTLFIISSKSFTTQETLTNANTAKDWFLKYGREEDIKKHFVAVSTNEKGVSEFGIDTVNMFVFWDWVGGRYSLWSSIGLSIALYLGFDNFNRLLDGAYQGDIHFKTTPFERNIPVIMAVLGVWYNNFLDANSYAVIPYDEYLSKLPDYLQQLDRESNGKFVNRNGNTVEHKTGPVIFGTAGTNAQHSFFQLIHQGTSIIPVDFIAPVNSHNKTGDHHKKLISNLIAQSEALMKGKNQKEAKRELKANGNDIDLLPYKIFTGNSPSGTFMFKKIDPEHLGKLISFYEHKVFVQGVIWNINSFDQWGVELGKQLAKKILPELEGDNKISCHDSSTNGLINFFKNNSEE